MKRLRCPLNGYRNISEFIYGGEYCREPSAANAEEWADFVYFSDNGAGTVLEWWCHAATSYWFLAERDTVSDQVLRTLKVADVQDIRGES